MMKFSADQYSVCKVCSILMAQKNSIWLSDELWDEACQAYLKDRNKTHFCIEEMMMEKYQEQMTQQLATINPIDENLGFSHFDYEDEYYTSAPLSPYHQIVKENYAPHHPSSNILKLFSYNRFIQIIVSVYFFFYFIVRMFFRLRVSSSI